MTRDAPYTVERPSIGAWALFSTLGLAAYIGFSWYWFVPPGRPPLGLFARTLAEAMRAEDSAYPIAGGAHPRCRPWSVRRRARTITLLETVRYPRFKLSILWRARVAPAGAHWKLSSAATRQLAPHPTPWKKLPRAGDSRLAWAFRQANQKE